MSTETPVSTKRQQNLAARKVAIKVEEQFLEAAANTKFLLDDVNVGKTDENLVALREALETERRLSSEYDNLKTKVAGL